MVGLQSLKMAEKGGGVLRVAHPCTTLPCESTVQVFTTGFWHKVKGTRWHQLKALYLSNKLSVCLHTGTVVR